MTKAEKREFRKELTHDLIMSWVKKGMTLEEAKALWKEMGEYK